MRSVLYSRCDDQLWEGLFPSPLVSGEVLVGTVSMNLLMALVIVIVGKFFFLENLSRSCVFESKQICNVSDFESAGGSDSHSFGYCDGVCWWW